MSTVDITLSIHVRDNAPKQTRLDLKQSINGIINEMCFKLEKEINADIFITRCEIQIPREEDSE